MESRLAGQDGMAREACRVATLRCRTSRVRSGSGCYVAEGLVDDSSFDGAGVTDRKCGRQDTTVANAWGSGRTRTLLPAHVVQNNTCVRQVTRTILRVVGGAEGRHCDGFSRETSDDNNNNTTAVESSKTEGVLQRRERFLRHDESADTTEAWDDGCGERDVGEK